jgi:hypothetical protein
MARSQKELIAYFQSCLIKKIRLFSRNLRRRRQDAWLFEQMEGTKMKKIGLLFLAIILLIGMTACSLKGVERDYPAAIMIDDVVYALSLAAISGEVDKSSTIGYTSYKDTYPAKNGECNFSKESMPYARVAEGIVVLYENEWRLCIPMDEGRAEHGENRQTTGTEQTSENKQSNDDNSILKEPPALTVCTWDQSLEAMRGVTSWMYSTGGDNWAGLQSDSMHPLDEAAKKRMLRLSYTLSMLDRMQSTDAILCFSAAPDKVTVRCWDEKYWGDTGNDDKAESIPVTGEDMYITLKESGYIYEVIAEWNSNPLYYGTAYYSFYAAPAYDASSNDALVTVSSGERTVNPYLHFAYSADWTGDGFLCADGAPVDGELKEWSEASFLPEIVWSEDFTVTYADGVKFTHIIVFNEAREQQNHLYDLSDLAALSSGKYYIGVVVCQEGQYIEQAKESEYTGWACLFKLIIE